jgi:hypothetical protein
VTVVARWIDGRTIVRATDGAGRIHLIEALSAVALCGELAEDLSDLGEPASMDRVCEVCYQRFGARG